MKEIKIVSNSYKIWLKELKQKFQTSQIKASIQVNSIFFNCGITCSIITKQLVSQIEKLNNKTIIWLQVVAKNENIIFPQIVAILSLIPWGYNRINKLSLPAIETIKEPIKESGDFFDIEFLRPISDEKVSDSIGLVSDTVVKPSDIKKYDRIRPIIEILRTIADDYGRLRTIKYRITVGYRRIVQSKKEQ